MDAFLEWITAGNHRAAAAAAHSAASTNRDATWTGTDAAQLHHVTIERSRGGGETAPQGQPPFCRGHGLYFRVPPGMVIGEGAAAGLPFPAPTTLVSVPSRFLINGNSLMECVRASEIVRNAFVALHQWMVVDQRAECVRQLDERLMIMLFLLLIKHYPHLFARSSSSKDTAAPSMADFCHYVRVLPTSFDTPVFWNDEELAALHSTPLHGAALAKRKKLAREWNDLRVFFDALKIHEEAPSPVTESEYAWADGVFWSRVLTISSREDEPSSVEKKSIATAAASTGSASIIAAAVDDDNASLPFPQPDYHLIPVIDFCNHSPFPLVRWEPPSEEYGAARLITYPGISLSHDTELTLSYGLKSTGELLFTYGFVPESSQYESFNFSLGIHECKAQSPLKYDMFCFLRVSPFIEVHQEDHDLEISVETLIHRILGIPSLAALLIVCLDEKEDGIVVDRETASVFVHDSPVRDVETLVLRMMKSERWPLLQLRVMVLLADYLRKDREEMERSWEDVRALKKNHRVQLACLYRKVMADFLADLLDRLAEWETTLMQQDYVCNFLADTYVP